VRRFSAAEKRAYARSNDLPAVPFAPDAAVRAWAVEIEVALARDDQEVTRRACQSLLDALCDLAGVAHAVFKLKDAAYARFRGGRAVYKLYGTCDRDGTITVAYRTAVQRKVFAYRTFLDTVVHEFMHHYDVHGLRLAASFHTSGFYQRVRAITAQLVE
jgi:predicted metalloprotease with PDZ domain